MRKPLTPRPLPQPTTPNPNVLYEEEHAPKAEAIALPAAESPKLITFSSYLLPGTMTRLYRWAYQNRMSVQDALNELLDAMLITDPNADQPMSEKAEVKLQEKLSKQKK